jgi:hypothetical protein
LAVIGPANGEVIPVLTRVITDDGARHVFVYNSLKVTGDGLGNNREPRH